MKKNSIIIDVAIDQCGSVETITKATTNDNPTFIMYDVIHYSVANMPGGSPKNKYDCFNKCHNPICSSNCEY